MVITPKQSNGESLGMTTLLYLIGTSVGSIPAGIFYQTVLPLIRSFPTPQSYNLIFLTAVLMSVMSIVLVGTTTGRRAKPIVLK